MYINKMLLVCVLKKKYFVFDYVSLRKFNTGQKGGDEGIISSSFSRGEVKREEKDEKSMKKEEREEKKYGEKRETGTKRMILS